VLSALMPPKPTPHPPRTPTTKYAAATLLIKHGECVKRHGAGGRGRPRGGHPRCGAEPQSLRALALRLAVRASPRPSPRHAFFTPGVCLRISSVPPGTDSRFDLTG
jgi:hypothetical protein